MVDEHVTSSGCWHDSEPHSGTPPSVEETMTMMFSPQQWRDVGTDPLSATGTI